ncbi:DNA-binding protein [Xenorhabdus sp. PR6a]|uniref:DNA-binding protein n=1 Tax=Xenorhabdus sp. PR6a TaxID=3025877 RepID=UPI0023597BA9|nr:DNA-binding protein [Xenorhabdus sp. PR6a]MDC9582340.1 DNA-binding protein [Xenorhabdus sp. PR6a]
MTTKEERTRLSASQWAEAEAAWSSGEFSLSQLEERFGVRRETLSRHFKKRKVVKGTDAVGKLVRDAIKSEAEIRAKERTALIEERRGKYDRFAFNIAALLMREVTEGSKSTATGGGLIGFAEREANIKALQRASITLSKCFEVSSKALNMDKVDVEEDDLPSLMFGELTQSQVAELRKSDEPVDLSEELEMEGEGEDEE